jgi:hypothetical protein
MTLIFQAHSDGKVIVPDEPRDLPINTRLQVRVEVLADSPIQQETSPRLPLTLDLAAIRAIVENPQEPWRPLDVQIDPQLGRAIAEDPELDIEES